MRTSMAIIGLVITLILTFESGCGHLVTENQPVQPDWPPVDIAVHLKLLASDELTAGRSDVIKSIPAVLLEGKE